MFTAVVRVTGAGRLADFRERLRWLMVGEEEAEDYTEHHSNGALEYRFAPKRGIPFPAFTAASLEYPELQVRAEWDHDGLRGHALIENGRLVEQSPELAPQWQVDVAVSEDGRLLLAMVCAPEGDALIGYAATDESHTYFRFSVGRLQLIDVQSPDEALEKLAFAFVEEWLWYDEEEAALERARYAAYGQEVRGANLRSDKLALLRRSQLRHSSLDEHARQARQALVSQWPKRR